MVVVARFAASAEIDPAVTITSTEADELGGKLRESVSVVVRPARLEGDVLPVHVAQLAHPLAKRIP
jgi:hypothetical protein